MTCAEAADRLAARLTAAVGAAGERQRAVEHFRSCGACRRQALEDDPTLLFIDLPAEEPGAGAVQEMRQAVAALRRAKELERSVGRPAGRRGRKVAAGALLVAALLLHPGGGGPEVGGSGSGNESTAGHETPVSSLLDSELLSPSLIENLDRPDARIYQLTEKDLSVVMIVDESLGI